MKHLVVPLVVALVAGCAQDPRAESVSIETLPAPERAAYDSVKLLLPTHLQGKQVEVLGLVTGHACQHTFLDKPVTEQQALDQARVYASRLGANGVTDLQCSRDISPRCSSAVSCSVKALKVSS